MAATVAFVAFILCLPVSRRGRNVRALRSVLLTYAMYNFDLGYVQVPCLPHLLSLYNCLCASHASSELPAVTCAS